MSNKPGNTIKLRELIYMYSEASMQTTATFLRLWRLAYRGWVNMGMATAWHPKTVSLPVNANRTVTFPNDYIQWIRVGMQTGNEIITLRNNQSMFTATGIYAGAADLLRTNMWFHGWSSYGISKNEGFIEFKVVDDKYILLDTNFEGDSLLFEYLAAPEKDDDFSIPIQFQEAMIDWISWQDIKHMPRMRGGRSSREASLAYAASLSQAKRMWKPFRISDIVGETSEMKQTAAATAANVNATALLPIASTCPTGIVITSTIERTIPVSWSAVTNATKYKAILYSNASGTVVIDEKETFDLDTRLGNSTMISFGGTYYVRVLSFVDGEYLHTNCALNSITLPAP